MSTERELERTNELEGDPKGAHPVNVAHVDRVRRNGSPASVERGLLSEIKTQKNGQVKISASS